MLRLLHWHWFQRKIHNMLASLNYFDFVPQIVPSIMSGTKLTYKLRLNPWKRSDKRQAIYLHIYQNKANRKLSLGLAVPKKDFDVKRQRVRSSFKFAEDYNLVIEKLLADINAIEVNCRLNDEQLTIDSLIEELTNPSLRINFNTFYKKMLEHQHDNNYIKTTTYKQQLATHAKLKRYKDPIPFGNIDVDFLNNFKHWLKTHEKNKPATVQIAVKNFKKYLKMANDKKIRTPLHYTDVKVQKVEGEITFLLPAEVKALHQYYNSAFISPTWKSILQRYLFSCFTGLRISDIKAIKEENFIDDVLVFNSFKSEKLQRIKLNKTAIALVEFPQVFNGKFSEQVINRELKKIATACNIKKRLYYHSSRHTFATNYLIAGGQIQNLQKLLGHSKVDTTMIYSHVVESLMNKEVGLLDGILD